jgi:hypothetical protein
VLTVVVTVCGDSVQCVVTVDGDNGDDSDDVW